MAVFVDGPLAGQVMALPPHAWRGSFAYRDDAGTTVIYRFTDIPMFTHTIQVGSVKYPPESEDCFRVLLSEVAKQAAGC